MTSWLQCNNFTAVPGLMLMGLLVRNQISRGNKRNVKPRALVWPVISQYEVLNITLIISHNHVF
jgi:hypothetical protein